MRDLLLAGSAAIAVTWAAPALAQTASPELSLPPTLMQGVLSKPGAVQGANSSNNVSAAPGSNGIANPVPGSIVVRVNARVVFYAAAESSSLDKTAGTGPINAGAAKVDPYTTLGFMRLYFGMDGLATNGLRYGGTIEIRQNGAGVGGSTQNTGSSGSTTSETLYVRRAFGYVAGDRWGIVRFGQGDSPLGIFDNGVTTFQNFDDAGWNGDVNGAIPSNAQPVFPFLSLTGSDYGSSKIAYFSPQYAGFDVGLSYAPNNSGLQDANCAIASSSCYNLSSSATAADATRYTNWYVAAARYQQLFGPVGLYAMGAYYGSGHVNYTGSSAPGSQFDALSVGDFGAALQYAGFVVGGHVTTGVTNGVGGLQPKGGVHAIVWLGGIQWAGGPLTIGGSFYNYQSQGSPALVGITQRSENALALGLTYNISPGISIWAQYLYGTRYQGNFDFQTGAVGSAFNNVKSQAFGVGPVVRW